MPSKIRLKSDNMMRECEEHGYFRDEYCPVCGEEGKFIMNDYELEKLGRTMAGILRHGRFDLRMDDQGFVRIKDIVATVKENNGRMHWIRPHHIIALVETDPKGRLLCSRKGRRSAGGDLYLHPRAVSRYSNHFGCQKGRYRCDGKTVRS